MRDHKDIDARSLALAKAIADHLRADPTLVNLAKENIQRWLLTCSAGVRTTLLEWDKVLNGTIEGVFDLLCVENERATRLRQSNPFAGALSNQERNAIFQHFEALERAKPGSDPLSRVLVGEG